LNRLSERRAARGSRQEVKPIVACPLFVEIEFFLFGIGSAILSERKEWKGQEGII
jgi:hypothetical protein